MRRNIPLYPGKSAVLFDHEPDRLFRVAVPVPVDEKIAALSDSRLIGAIISFQ